MVIQQGARRNYIYAQQLEQAGMLHSLVCDSAWPQGRENFIIRIIRSAIPRAAGPIERRRVSGVDPSRVLASLWPNIASPIKILTGQERAYALIDEVLAFRTRLRGLTGARAIVNYQGNGGSYLIDAKRHGAKIATDFIITPKHLEIEHQERERWPGWEEPQSSQSMLDFYRRRMAHLVKISDLYLCPSQTVARNLADLPGFDASRVRLVPYGISGVLLAPATPAPGRVLFAGAAGLRKGIPYLAEAARLLKTLRPNIEVVVAGAVSAAIRNRPETKDLTFIGQIDRQRMADEMARADIFCLPSLAEGSATAIYEALANGLPVVTTPSSGSVVEHDKEGIIVSERNGPAIADAILHIVDDRIKRQRMAEAARATALRYSDEACGQVFIQTIRELLAMSDRTRRPEEREPV